MTWREEIIKKIISLALEEDLSPNGDISLNFIDNPNEIKTAHIIAKEDGVMACSWIAQAVLDEYISCHCEQSKAIHTQVKVTKQDGESFKEGDLLLEITAPIHCLLSCERTILNFLQRMCAIAKASKEYTELIKDYKTELLDTRKTMPGMRVLEKEAFKAGGGTNHRLNLSTAVMLKDNHLSVILSKSTVILSKSTVILSKSTVILSDSEGSQKHPRDSSPLTQNDGKKTIVEINKDNLNQLEKWLELGVDQIMLDNFSPEEISSVIASEAWQSRPKDSKTKIEVSGNITKANIIDYAKTGVDYISTSACMTRVHNLDLSMKITD